MLLQNGNSNAGLPGAVWGWPGGTLARHTVGAAAIPPPYTPSLIIYKPPQRQAYAANVRAKRDD